MHALQVVKLLMDYSHEKSIDLDARESLQYSNCGWTAFFFACHKGHSDVVKLMMEYSSKVAIDFNVRCGWAGNTPFMVACRQGHSQVVKLFLENSNNLNIDVNATSVGVNGLMLACYKGHKNVVRLFLDYSGPIKIDLNVRDQDGRSAFDIASRFGKTEVVNLFQEYSKRKKH